MTAIPRATVHPWYERFADWILANPDKNISDAAPFFNCHVNTLYIIKNSAAFQKYFQERSARISKEIENGMVAKLTGMVDKAEGLAEMALDELSHRVEKKGRDLPIGDLLSVADLTMKKLGYGVTPVGAVPGVQINLNSVTPEDIERARNKMLERQSQVPATQPEQAAGPVTIDITPEEV